MDLALVYGCAPADAETSTCVQELQCSAEDIGASAGTLLLGPDRSASDGASTSPPVAIADVHEALLLLQPQAPSLLNPERNLGIAAHHSLGSAGTCLLPGAAQLPAPLQAKSATLFLD